jgi:hypothetical protein
MDWMLCTILEEGGTLEAPQVQSLAIFVHNLSLNVYMYTEGKKSGQNSLK